MRRRAVRVPLPVSGAEIRAPRDDEREQLAVVDGDIVATAGEFPFDQWFAGNALAYSAVWGVATLPEHRGSGLASAATEACFDPRGNAEHR